MPITGTYEPSSWDWVHDQVEEYERSGHAANTLLDTGMPVIIVTTHGNKSGKVRKMALIRVEHDGRYALVASIGGAPTNPVWYNNVKANPTEVAIQDGPEPFDADVRELEGDERREWWTKQSLPIRPMPSTRRTPRGSSRSSRHAVPPDRHLPHKRPGMANRTIPRVTGPGHCRRYRYRRRSGLACSPRRRDRRCRPRAPLEAGLEQRRDHSSERGDPS